LIAKLLLRNKPRNDYIYSRLAVREIQIRIILAYQPYGQIRFVQSQRL
jgi:hypothetical protein